MPYRSHARFFDEEHLPAAVDAWFDAMAALHRAAPWDAGVDPRRPLYATLGSQDIDDVVLHPLGRADGPPGLAWLSGPDDLEAWLALETVGGAPRSAPGFFRLEVTFGALADAHPDVRLELERHDRGLGDAVPSVWRVDDGGTVQPGDVDDLMRMESVAAALAAALEAPPGDGGLMEAWRNDEPASRTARAGGQELEVVLSTRPATAEVALPASALVEALRGIDELNDGWIVESRERAVLESRLDRRFLRSPEAADLADGTRYWHMFAHYAAAHLGVTVASLGADGVHEIVFDLVPRKVSTDVDYAWPFIGCLRAFYRWLMREYGLPQAQACLAVLEAPDAVERLEELLADDTGFDPAKAMVMAARAQGIDPSTPEGAVRMRAMMNERFEAGRASEGSMAFDPYDDAPRAKPPLDPEAQRKARKKGR